MRYSTYICLLILTSTCFCETISSDNSELVLAFMIHRHGDRAPVESHLEYASDARIVAELSSEYGYGQLTDRGKRRSYDLGQFIRTRYNSLLSNKYNLSEVYIRSTDSTRTKMTVLTAMTAVYPAGNDNWSEDINWTPIPYTTVPAIYDHNLAILNCPLLKETYTSNLKSPVPEMSTKYATLLNELADINGADITEQPLRTYIVHDFFVSQKNLGVPLNEVTEAIMPDLRNAAADSMDILFGQKFINLRQGVLLKEFFDAADKLISGKDPQKVYIYSAHDVNVYSFTVITKIYPRISVPKYASLYALELRKVVQTGKYIVVPVYLEEPGAEVKYLEIEGCGTFCDYGTFKNLTSEYTLNEKQWRIQCAFDEDYDFDMSAII